MSATIPMKVKAYLASLTRSGNLPPVELVRIAPRYDPLDEHAYMCRVKNTETGEIFPMSIHVRGFMVAQHPLDSQQLAKLDAEERWQSYMDLDVNAVPKRPNRNPFRGKNIIHLKRTTEQEREGEITTEVSPDTIQGHTLVKGDYIGYRMAEPTEANPDAPPQAIPTKKGSRGLPLLGYYGKVVRFTDTRIVVQSGREKALYYVRPGDVILMGKKKRGEQGKS